ncbi:lytic transglycosylase domain-containing protein [Brevundimonas fontaquae]|uniref:Lytic transglycosylase domain-containing protein n=1 Tax=Brevundimonas fontaquae TaxID=2813778 RepID=A0ABX7LPV1_9CAUL|nr:lytic transglycosylase domain-containing protein [Brevundimonas fontaquae]QSF54859.1 lytic transglycosylase domain-containing protein [Brevundimonas fontaquae]
MVRPFLAALALALATCDASAQSVDWRIAGGDLFGRPASQPVSDLAGVEDATPRLPPLSQPFMDAIAAAAERHGLDPKMLHALVIVESAYRVDAVSPVGAGGLTQLMPGTAADLGVRDRFDPIENLNGGADYLARQLLRFGDVKLAFAAYNSGPDRVARLGRIPNIAETQAYVAAAIDCYLALSAGRGARNSRECQAREPGR